MLDGVDDYETRQKLARIEEMIAALRQEQAALQAEVGGALAPEVADSRVEARGRGIAVGGTITNSVAISGHVEGNVYVGPVDSSPEDAVRAYCEVVVSMCSHLPLRAVDVAASDATGRPERVDLDAIYVELDTTTFTAAAVGKGERDRGRDGMEPALAQPLLGLVPRLRALEAAASNRRAVLLGAPGSGKSTFLRYVALCLAAHHLDPAACRLRRLAGWTRAETGLLPIEIVLRDLAAALPAKGKIEPKHVWAFIAGRLRGQNLDAAAVPLLAALQSGRALVLFDGLDEIPDAAQQARVRDAVAIFAARYEKSDVLVTCRKLSYELAACKLPDMPSFELAPFDDTKIHGFIDGWYQELLRRGTHGAAETAALAQDLHEAVRRPDLRGLSSNPLLLTVMALVHASDGRLPGARALLYERTVELLLWRWDDHRTRRLRKLLEQAGVSEINLKMVLWALAFEAHGASPARRGDALADIPEHRIVKALAERHPQGSYDWAKEMVEVMKLRAGLLIERERDVYTFPHRTFQEYLAGAHLSVQVKFAVDAARLSRGSSVWREPVLLAAGRLVEMGDTGRPVELLGELCPVDVDDTKQGWRDVWMAGDVLVEVGPNTLRESQSGRDLAERVRGRLVELVRKGKLAPVERARAGDALGRIGDPRFLKDFWYLPAEEMMGLVEIPAGPFLMGSDPDKDASAYADETPQHPVTLPAYYMARYPVTVEQFQAFVRDTGYEVGDPECLRGNPNHPVVLVSWEEAWTYADWLTKKLRRSEKTHAALLRLLRGEGADRKTWRVVLPSESEWEKASRGTEGKVYPWGDRPDHGNANYKDTGIGGTSVVGCFAAGASAYGCEEMSGNVWEWTRSAWRNDVGIRYGYPYVSEDGRETRGTSSDLPRVVRGSAFGFGARVVRCAIRGVLPLNGSGNVGFRVAVSPHTSVF
jgi:formylglycine-generating enzyme required for sulfatase activity